MIQVAQGKLLLSPRRKVGRELILKRITSQEYTRFLSIIVQGAFDHVAAGCIGVTPETYFRWMRRGREARKGIFRKFYLDVLRAQALARRQAESEVKLMKALDWLRSGPGRTTEELPGWTEKAAIEIQQPINVNIGEQGPTHEDKRATMAEAMAELERLGLIQTTERGRQVLGIGGPVIDADEVTESDLFDEGDETPSKPDVSTNGQNGHATDYPEVG